MQRGLMDADGRVAMPTDMASGRIGTTLKMALIWSAHATTVRVLLELGN